MPAFDSSHFEITDPTDHTKRVRILASTVTTNTLRSLTSPDRDGTIALVIRPYVAKTGNYTATASDEIIFVDATSAAVTITLPDASTSSGRVYVIKKVDGSANTVTVDGSGSQTIDGDLTKIISDRYVAMTIVSDGSNWGII